MIRARADAVPRTRVRLSNLEEITVSLNTYSVGEQVNLAYRMEIIVVYIHNINAILQLRTEGKMFKL